MAHTYVSNFLHVVFSTKERANLIPEAKEEALRQYMTAIARNHRIQMLATGGTRNHVHLLFALPATCALSDAVNTIKANSSRWMRETDRRFSWQEGYGAFSISPSQLQAVKEYILNQHEHHRKRSFEEEFVALLRRCGVAYDPKYVFG